jgi:hypothetical protein
MTDAAFKIVLLFLLLSWSGYFVYRLGTGVVDAWRVGRFGVSVKGKADTRVVRSSARPIEFWFTMTIWHVMLIVFAVVFTLGIHGVYRVIAN